MEVADSLSWRTFSLPAGQGEPQSISTIVSVSRLPNTMETWWITKGGAVEGAYWYEGGNGWQRYQLSPPGTARGGLAAVSRKPETMEVYWAGPKGSIENAYWYAGSTWKRQQIVPIGKAAIASDIATVARRPDVVDIWFVGPNGGIQGAYWAEGQLGYRFYDIGGSAESFCSIVGVARHPETLEIWWASKSGAIDGAYWYAGSSWTRYNLAPNGSSRSQFAGLACNSKDPKSLNVWWMSPARSVEGAHWNEGVNPWTRYQIAPNGVGSFHNGIAALSRNPKTEEIWFVDWEGTVMGAFWYEGMTSWKRYRMPSLYTAKPATRIGAVSRLPNTMEIFYVGKSGALTDHYFYDTGRTKSFTGSIVSGGLAALGGSATIDIAENGNVRWRGNAHDSGFDGYDYVVTGYLWPKAGSHAPVIVCPRKGDVSRNKRDDPWSIDDYISGVRDNFKEYEQGRFDLTTIYESDLTNLVEGVFNLVIKLVVGYVTGGTTLILIVVGTATVSLIQTGSIIPGLRVMGGVMMWLGPTGTLLAIGSDLISSAGSRTRQVTPEEYACADVLFRGTLPPRENLLVTDVFGLGDRAFTFPRWDGKIYLNIGPASYDDPLPAIVRTGMMTPETPSGSRTFSIPPKSHTFIHELCHAWQIHQRSMDAPMLGDLISSKLKGGSSYTYGKAGTPFRDINFEAQAQLVADWWAGFQRDGGDQTGYRMDPNSPYMMYIRDNIRGAQYA